MFESERDRDEMIRRRAYELWEQAGRPEGVHEEFWHEAAAEMAPPGDAAVQRGAESAGMHAAPTQM